MHFQSITIAAIAGLSASVYAQNAAQSAAFASDVENYLTKTLATDVNLGIALIPLETDTAALAHLTSVEGNLPGLATDSAAEISSLLGALPSAARPIFSSVLAEVTSIAVKDGVLNVTSSATDGAATATKASSSAGAAKETGNGATRDTIERGLLAGSLMGVVGLMAAL